MNISLLHLLALQLVLVVTTAIADDNSASGGQLHLCVKPSPSVNCPESCGWECKTLEEYAADISRYFRSNTTLVFLPGCHKLNTTVTVPEGLSNIEIRGRRDCNNSDNQCFNNTTWFMIKC